MCAHARAGVHVQTTAHRSGSEDDIRCQSLPSTLFETGSLFAMVCTKLASLQAPRESPVSASLSLHRRARIRTHKPIFMWVLEMGPQVFTLPQQLFTNRAIPPDSCPLVLSFRKFSTELGESQITDFHE